MRIFLRDKMGKRCIICTEEAEFRIKDTSDYYCQDCANGNFADLKMLIKIEEEAQRLKEMLNEKLKEQQDNDLQIDQDRQD